MKKLLAMLALVAGCVSMSGLEGVRIKNNNTGAAFTFTLTKKQAGASYSVTINNNAAMSETSTHSIMGQSIEPGDTISIIGIGVAFYNRTFTYDRETRGASELISIGLWSTPNYSETKYVIQ